VARLAQAQATGSLTLSLASDATELVEGTIETDTKSMLGIVEVAPVVEAPVIIQEKCYAKQRKGGEVVDTSVEIPCQP
jgi:pilus assembly protein CpaB